MKKLKTFQLILIVIFILFLIFLIKPKNYTQEYTINNVNITESFNKKKKSYYFAFNYKNINLDMLYNSNYKNHRTFIKDINVIEDKDNFCLIPSGDTFDFIPICYDNKKSTHYTMVNAKLKDQLDKKYFSQTKKITTYQDIEIYSNDYSYYIWNYNGFYYINSNQNTKIDIFKKELYTINLIGYTEDYLVIPDYDSDYTFHNFYTLQKGKLKKHSLNRDIYFDSYYPGYEKNKLYIIDNKEECMYEFNAQNGNLEKIKTKMLNKGNWEKANIKTLINQKKNFTYNTNINYTLIDNNIYLNYLNKKNKTIIATNVKNIVKIDNEDIFYLKEDSLYHFNPTKGEKLLLKYFEWNFNYENMIYIN